MHEFSQEEVGKRNVPAGQRREGGRGSRLAQVCAVTLWVHSRYAGERRVTGSIGGDRTLVLVPKPWQTLIEPRLTRCVGLGAPSCTANGVIDNQVPIILRV